jgi:MFS family permease
MTLDSAVMNVSIAQVAEDVGTTVTGIQTAITLYTLVMATMMITGGKIGSLIGRRRAFAIGCVIYGVGSLTTALAPNLTVLIIGWSILEGLGAALIMPAIVALVASNFAPSERPRAYGLVASAGAIAVAAGPLIGGTVTTYWSWRYVFAGEVVIVLGILALSRRMHDTAPESRARLDLVGAALTAAGLGLAVYGVLRSGEWGWIRPRPNGPEFIGMSPTIWLILGGALVLWLFLLWEERVVGAGREPLVRVEMFQHKQMNAVSSCSSSNSIRRGSSSPFRSSSPWLWADCSGDGVRCCPASHPPGRGWRPQIRPEPASQGGSLGSGVLFTGIVSDSRSEIGAGPEIVTVPMLLAGLGVGALASQLGAVTVSGVPDEESGEVGGLQNTMTNLGASLGTALAGSILIAGLTFSFLEGIAANPDIPPDVVSQADVELASGIPFVSNDQLETALAEAGFPPEEADAILQENEAARISGLRASLACLAVIAAAGLFFTRMMPTLPTGSPVEARRLPSTGEDPVPVT